jgi:hypothetical protein
MSDVPSFFLIHVYHHELSREKYNFFELHPAQIEYIGTIIIIKSWTK